jgi:hypothetical protein
MKSLNFIFAVFFIALFFAACNEDELNPTGDSVATLKSGTIAFNPVYCGGPVQYGLKGGPDLTYTGSVSVANDGNFLIIEVVSLKGFQNVMDGSIDVGIYKSLPPQSMPVTTNFNYHYNPTEGPNEYGLYIYTISIPLSTVRFEDDNLQVGLKCGQSVNIIVHVDAIMELVPGVLSSVDAWGAGIVVSGYSEDGTLWQYKYINYSTVCCVCDGETAWANGNPYPGKNWALYTTYFSGETKTVNLLAGKTQVAGTATIKPSAIPGYVTITINLDKGGNWSLQNVTEPVKIQGYSSVPSISPIPGQFQTYKGGQLEVTIPQYAYYGIHLDIQKCRF